MQLIFFSRRVIPDSLDMCYVHECGRMPDTNAQYLRFSWFLWIVFARHKEIGFLKVLEM